MPGVNKLWNHYLDSYRGLSPAAWMLALTILINRSGSMVLPFMGLYLKEAQEFGLTEIGVILAMFGVGSALGSIIGGVLTDRLGAFRVQFYSLFFGGIGLFLFSFLSGFWVLALAMVVVSTITESLRPANIAAVASYAKPENITRAISLNRMAINLGFSVGPAIGGILAAVNYQYIFWFDGLTCLIASGVFYRYFHKREARPAKGNKGDELKRMILVLRDFDFLRFIGVCMVYAFGFFQLFNSLPLYLKEEGGLSEKTIGLLFALNGIMVFVLEMPMVDALTKKLGSRKAVMLGFVLAALAFAALLPGKSMTWFVLSYALLSLSEIAALPFLATMATQFATENNRGSYMGIFGLGFSLTHILAPSIALALAGWISFQGLWWVLMGLGMFIPMLSFFIRPRREMAMN